MGTINLRDVPDNIHKEAKFQALKEDISLKDLIIKALEEYLKKAKKKRR